MPKYDTNEPILVLIRRGRKGRGFVISPVDDISNSAPCANATEVGEVIEEMLEDENQSRVNINDLLAAASGPPEGQETPSKSKREDEDEDDDEEDEDEDDDEEDDSGESGSILDGVAGAKDPADQIMINLLSWGVNKGRNMSSKKVRVPTRPRKKKKKKKV